MVKSVVRSVIRSTVRAAIDSATSVPLDFNDVTLLLHMNGVDESTTFTDDSNSAHTVTAVGNAQIDTADKKYGTGAGLFDGTGDYLTVPYVADDFDWFVEDFTVECWVKAASWADWSNNGTPCLIGRMNPTSQSVFWSFGPNVVEKLVFHYWVGSSKFVTSTASISTGQWVHLAMSHKLGTGIKIFIDGVLDGSAAIDGTPLSATETLSIGGNNTSVITGSVDDLRITRGTAIYTANFTPPTAEFPDS